MTYLDILKNYNTQFGFLHMIVGPMFSGKSTKLINILKDLVSSGLDVEQDILIINHNSDNRFEDKEYIVSHDQEKFKCYKLQKIELIFDIFKYYNAKYIIIDEAQFFPDIAEHISNMLMVHQKHIIIAGLSSGSNMQSFEQVQKLYNLADKIEHLTAKCIFCGKEAPFQRRFKDISQDDIFVGTASQYYATCRYHNIIHANIAQSEAPVNKYIKNQI